MASVPGAGPGKPVDLAEGAEARLWVIAAMVDEESGEEGGWRAAEAAQEAGQEG